MSGGDGRSEPEDRRLEIGAFLALAFASLGIGLGVWRFTSPEQPQIPRQQAAQAPPNVYFPGGPECQDKAIAALEPRDQAAKRGRCNEAAEDHRIQAQQLAQATRSVDIAEGALWLSLRQARASAVQAVATALAAIFAFAAGVVAWRALTWAKRAAIHTENSAKTAREALNDAKSDAAVQSLRFEQQLAVEKATSIGQLRAYVALHGADLGRARHTAMHLPNGTQEGGDQHVTGDWLIMRCQLSNGGQSTATKLNIRIVGAIAPITGEPVFDPMPPIDEGGIVGPQRPIRTDWVGLPYADLERVWRREIKWVVLCRVEYRDIAGNKYHMQIGNLLTVFRDPSDWFYNEKKFPDISELAAFQSYSSLNSAD